MCVFKQADDCIFCVSMDYNGAVVPVSDLDACVEPVLDFAEARDHQHNRERGVFVEVRPGVYEPGKSSACGPRTGERGASSVE